MKGLVFAEFLEMVEAGHGVDMVDDLVEETDPPSGGAYTATGTYDHAELVAMVVALSRRTGTPVPDLVRAFGEHLFARFVALYPRFFDGIDDAYCFLESIHDVIHVEVLKLYPDATLPDFACVRHGPGRFEMIYRSSRHLEDLAHGLIAGCLTHFGESADISRTPNDDGTVSFILERRAA